MERASCCAEVMRRCDEEGLRAHNRDEGLNATGHSSFSAINHV